MDEGLVRQHAEAHAQATVAGDLGRAGNDLTPEAMAQAPAIMSAMPAPLTSAAVTGVRTSGGECVATIRYVGRDGEALVESRWAERDGRPKIVNLEVL
jgi:hypothetical protein